MLRIDYLNGSQINTVRYEKQDITNNVQVK